MMWLRERRGENETRVMLLVMRGNSMKAIGGTDESGVIGSFPDAFLSPSGESPTSTVQVSFPVVESSGLFGDIRVMLENELAFKSMGDN
jgi:hypothetical protein